MGEPPARRHLTGDDILALLPALSTVLSVWLGRGQEALWDDIEDLDALPEIAEGHAPAVHVIHAISVLGSQVCVLMHHFINLVGKPSRQGSVFHFCD